MNHELAIHANRNSISVSSLSHFDRQLFQALFSILHTSLSTSFLLMTVFLFYWENQSHQKRASRLPPRNHPPARTWAAQLHLGSSPDGVTCKTELQIFLPKTWSPYRLALSVSWLQVDPSRSSAWKALSYPGSCLFLTTHIQSVSKLCWLYL